LTARAIAAVVCVAAAAALAPAGGGAARSASIPFRGTATIAPVDVTKACGATSVSAKLLRVRCAQLGRFAGRPAPANVSFGWTWDLPTDSGGNPTGPATERATLILNFGTPGLLYLSLAGKQRVIGKTTATRAKAVTNGTWTITKGTEAFVGRHGKGTYTFTATRNGSANVFSVAKVALSGAIT
jgi:hypothetical protein